jgi:predicted Zn-dependent protease
MKPKYYLATFAIVASGTAIGTYVVPQGGELAMIYYKSGRYEAARQVLENDIRAGDLSPSTVFYGVQTFLRLSELDRALDLVERYVERRPNDLIARGVLGQLYDDAGKPTLYLRNLEYIQARAPTVARQRELTHLYRIRGEYANWAAAVALQVADETAWPSQYFALARLLAAEGKIREAAEVLERMFDRFEPDGKPEHKKTAKDDPDYVNWILVSELAISLELDLDRPAKAFALAERGVRLVPGAVAAMALADILARRRQAGLALRLLEPHAAEAADNTALLRMIVSLELELGRAEAAYVRLVAIEKAGKLDSEERDLLVFAALAAKKWDEAKAAFEATDVRYVSEGTLMELAREAVSREDVAFVRRIVARIDPRFLDQYPFVAAQIALALGDMAEAGRRAEQAERLGGLSVFDRLTLIEIYLRLDNRVRATAVLRGIGADEGVPEAMTLRMAIMYLRLGLAAEGLAVFDRLKARSSSPWVAAGHALLASRQRGEVDFAWAEAPAAGGRPPVEIITAVYFAAMDGKDYVLALAAARRLVQIEDNLDNKLRLARALAYAGRPAEAVAIVAPLAETNEDARAIYAVALINAVKEGKAGPEELKRFVVQRLADPRVSRAEKEGLVWELIGLKAFTIVLPALEELIAREGEAYVPLFIDALVAARDKKRLQSELARLIGKTEPGEILRRYGRAAYDEGLYELARQAFAKILRAQPNDPEALKRLGMLAFFRSEHDVARRYLTQYLQTGADDYLAEFALGESITQSADWERATPHYRRAFEKIERLKSPSFEDRKIRAKLLYRLARKVEARAAYEALLRERPGDRDLRDQYADFLDDTGEYERASQVRGRR